MVASQSLWNRRAPKRLQAQGPARVVGAARGAGRHCGGRPAAGGLHHVCRAHRFQVGAAHSAALHRARPAVQQRPPPLSKLPPLCSWLAVCFVVPPLPTPYHAALPCMHTRSVLHCLYLCDRRARHLTVVASLLPQRALPGHDRPARHAPLWRRRRRHAGDLRLRPHRWGRARHARTALPAGPACLLEGPYAGPRRPTLPRVQPRASRPPPSALRVHLRARATLACLRRATRRRGVRRQPSLLSGVWGAAGGCVRLPGGGAERQGGAVHLAAAAAAQRARGAAPQRVL